MSFITLEIDMTFVMFFNQVSFIIYSIVFYNEQ